MIKKHKEARDENIIPNKSWKWGINRITPKKVPPHVQLQHLRVRIDRQVDHDDDNSLVVKVICLVNESEDITPSSPVDINPSDIRVKYLFDILKVFPDLGYKENYPL